MSSRQKANRYWFKIVKVLAAGLVGFAAGTQSDPVFWAQVLLNL